MHCVCQSERGAFVRVEKDRKVFGRHLLRQVCAHVCFSFCCFTLFLTIFVCTRLPLSESVSVSGRVWSSHCRGFQDIIYLVMRSTKLDKKMKKKKKCRSIESIKKGLLELMIYSAYNLWNWTIYSVCLSMCAWWSWYDISISWGEMDHWLVLARTCFMYLIIENRIIDLGSSLFGSIVRCWRMEEGKTCSLGSSPF